MVIQAVMESMKKNDKERLGVEIGIWMCVGFAFIAIVLGLWIKSKLILNLKPLRRNTLN